MKQNDKLDIDTLLERNDITLTGLLHRFPKNQQPGILRCYIEGQLLRLEKEAAETWRHHREDEQYWSELDAGLFDALERAWDYGLEDTLERSMPLLDSLLQRRISPWLDYDSPFASAETSFEDFSREYLGQYLAVLHGMQAWGYQRTDEEAVQRLYESFAAEIEEKIGWAERCAIHEALSVMRFHNQKIERCIEFTAWCKNHGAAVDLSRALELLYGLFTRPREFSCTDWEFGNEVVLMPLDEAVDVLEERFEILERIEGEGYPIDYQRAAERYASGLSTSQFTVCASANQVGEQEKRILDRLAWLEKKGADLSEIYKQLAGDAIDAINEGSNPQGYLPLLEFLAEHDAFDSGQLALLEAISAPQHI